MIIKGATLLLKDKCNYYFAKKDILINSNIIERIDDNIEGDCKIIMADNMLLLPGMKNSHYHSYTNLLRGTSVGDEPLELWSLDTVALGSAMNEEDMRLSCQLGIIEMLRCGVTSLVDHIPHSFAVDTIAECYKSAKIRATIAPMLHNLSDNYILKGIAENLPSDFKGKRSFPSSISLYQNWIEKHHNSNGIITLAIAPNSPQRADDELLAEASKLANKYDLDIHCHLLETKWQRDSIDGESPVFKLYKHGLLNNRSSLAHSIWLTEQEKELIKKQDATIINNPTSNLFLSSGTLDYASVVDKNISLAFGSDGASCGTNHNMLEIARIAFLISKQKGEGLTVTKALDSLFGGEIKEGEKADVIVCTPQNSLLLSSSNMPAQLLLSTTSLNIRDVIINGEMVMENKELIHIDEQLIFNKIALNADSLSSKIKTALNSVTEMKEVYKKVYNKRS